MPAAAAMAAPAAQSEEPRTTGDDRIFGGPLIWGLVGLGAVVIILAAVF